MESIGTNFLAVWHSSISFNDELMVLRTIIFFKDFIVMCPEGLAIGWLTNNSFVYINVAFKKRPQYPYSSIFAGLIAYSIYFWQPNVNFSGSLSSTGADTYHSSSDL